MSVTSDHIFSAGEKVLLTADCEGDWRGAIGRFYYAVHHQAKLFHDALPSPGASTSDRGSHDTLCSQLQNPTIPRSDPNHTKSKQIGYMSKTLLGLRIKADYWVAENVSKGEATEAREIARRTLGLATPQAAALYNKAARDAAS
jgi:hypothetical protein